MAERHLLIIDPQNDFLDIEGAALPVAGANADMQRLADWLLQSAATVQSITVTLDSHASVGVERTPFWRDAQGAEVAPFTVVTAADMQAGRFVPRYLGLHDEVLAYLKALEASGQRQLVVWPVHCVLGTWGHNIHGGLSQALAHWERQSGRTCHKVIKGQHPLTEQYSAFKAEVPRTDDARTHINLPLIHSLLSRPGRLLVAGEALSHCVAASVDDLAARMNPEQKTRTVLLRDCMSPVTGFETMGQAFLDRARDSGMQVLTLAELD